MQNESDKLKTLLLGILELTLVGEDQALTSEEKTALIGALALSAGRHLGFTAEELIGTLKNPDDKYTRKAIELVARLAIESKEYQKHGETRND